MRHTISVLVENEFGVLARVAGMFSGRGFNIESLSVAETMDPTVSCITLVTAGDDTVLEQITKQLNKLVPVIRVSDFKGTAHVERELVLIKVKADERTRDIPIIFYTADSDPSAMSEAIRLGARDYLIKASTPWNELCQTVERYAAA